MIFCFGELLLRMSPALEREWLRQSIMPVYIGGAELNVASALAKWEVPVKYCTALPDQYLSEEICEELRHKNIDISPIHFSGERIGIYYLPQGKDLKHAGVIYDRSNSSFSRLQPGMINWDEVLKDCNWFHFSAITPGLNENIAAVCNEGLEAAVSKGLNISVDLNFRSLLWKYGKQPVEIMPKLVGHCNVIMGNIWSAAELLGIKIDEDIHHKKSKTAYLNHATKTSSSIFQKYKRCKVVCNTFRFDSGEGISYYATLNEKKDQYVSPQFETSFVIDKVGSGDCFMAGLIYGLYHKNGMQDVINYATAAAFAKLHEKGDATNQTVDSVKNILSLSWVESKI